MSHKDSASLQHAVSAAISEHHESALATEEDPTAAAPPGDSDRQVKEETDAMHEGSALQSSSDITVRDTK